MNDWQIEIEIAVDCISRAELYNLCDYSKDEKIREKIIETWKLKRPITINRIFKSFFISSALKMGEKYQFFRSFFQVGITRLIPSILIGLKIMLFLLGSSSLPLLICSGLLSKISSQTMVNIFQI